MIKKFVATGLALMMAASLAGCGSGNQNTAPAGSTAAESKAETETQKTETQKRGEHYEKNMENSRKYADGSCFADGKPFRMWRIK